MVVPAVPVLILRWPLLAVTLMLSAFSSPLFSDTPQQAEGPSSQAELLPQQEIDRLLAILEDPEQREELSRTLRNLSAAAQDQEAREVENVKTAAAQLVETVARKARDASQSAGHLVESISGVPQHLHDWALRFSDARHRDRWLTIAWRLAIVLGAGFGAAWLVRRLLHRGDSEQPATALALASRISALSGLLLRDLLPICALALVSYGVLTLVDPRQELRLVAVALINASVFVRLVMLAAEFLLSPQRPQLRLWPIGDESANYLYQWTRRLSFIGIYGFFGLQAGLLLGMSAEAYATLIRLLGLMMVLLLIVLIAQNRHDLAFSIASDDAADIDEPDAVSSFRRGFARVWHLVAGVYLVVVYAIWALRIPNGAAYLLRATLITLATLAVAKLLSHLLDQVFNRGLRLSRELRAQYPGLERRLNRYFPTLRKLSKLFLAILAALLIGHAWGIDTLEWITQGSGKVLVGAVLHILLVLGIAFLVWEMASGSIENYLVEVDHRGRERKRSARTKTLLTVARNALLVVLTVVTLLMVLSELGINIAPLLAGAGVVGLAIGFGAQRLVQDVINGAFILFQDLMSVGDVVKLGDKGGVVEALSIRTVRLRDLGGAVHTIPFSSIEAVSNLTREYAFHVFDLGIAYREDVDEVMELIRGIVEELREDEDTGPLILEPVEIFGLDQFGDSALVIKGRIKTLPLKHWAVGRAFNRLVKIRFDERNIEIPFPHQTLYFGQDKDGSAAPAFIQVEQLLRPGPNPDTTQPPA